MTAEIIDVLQELQRIVASCEDPELLNFAQHVRDAGAKLYARLADGSEIELHFPVMITAGSDDHKEVA